MTLEPSMFASFLQENYLNFFGDIDNIADASQYLSDTDTLACLGSVSITYIDI